MKPHAIAAAALAALLALPGAAHASASGQITLGQFTYSLTDLDPNDGIAPSIVFLPSASFAPGFVGLAYHRNGVDGGNLAKATGAEPIASFTDWPGLSLGGRVHGTGDPSAISLEGYASIDQADGSSGHGITDVGAAFDFILSPNTALTVSLAEHITASATGYPGDQIDRLDAEASMYLYGPNNAILASFDDFVSVNGSQAPVDRIGQLGGTYANTGAASLAGTLVLDGNLWAIGVSGPVSPVPEARPLAMYAAGLPLLLALRRRARRRGPDTAA